jgi:thymidylate kinase
MKRDMPRIVIVEGLWGIGKSTLICAVRRRLPVLFIPEPNYLISGIKLNISRWYRREHNKRLRLAKEFALNGDNIILERSILSSVAYQYAQHRVLPEWFSSSNRELFSSPELRVFFLFGDKGSFLKCASTIEDGNVRRTIVKTPDFYEKYIEFFREVAPRQIASKIVCVKAESKDRAFRVAQMQIVELLGGAPNEKRRA